MHIFAVAEPELMTPRECGPEQSKKPIAFGFSGFEMSNSSKPAGCKSFFEVS